MGQPLRSENETAISKIAEVTQKVTGVQLGARQMGMVRSRLMKRLLSLGLPDYQSYYEYFQKNFEHEMEYIVSLLTTHHTFFFREFRQFEFLAEQGLDQIIPAVRVRGDGKLRIWSAACSRGQEVYSLAMFVSEHLAKLAPDIKLEILGTDIDAESVAFAKNAVYSWNEVKEIPRHYLAEYWQRGTGDIANFAKVKNNIRNLCRFETRNLLHLEKCTPEHFDIIFCRNVFIYFDNDTITNITNQFMQRLHEHGLFFIGVSESLAGLRTLTRSLGFSVYCRDKHQPLTIQPATPVVVKIKPPPARKPIRVLCVDDSASIIQLLSRILSKEQGFEVVATAKNGLEAKAAIALHPVDVVTLDIHMPEQNGIEYLEHNYATTHPPVVMVTSVNREDADLAKRALDLGACDFVEKPALSNLEEKGDEIRAKLKMAFLSRLQPHHHGQPDLEKDHWMQQRNLAPADGTIIIVVGTAELSRLDFLRREYNNNFPPLVILVESGEYSYEKSLKALAHFAPKPLNPQGLMNLSPGTIYTTSFDGAFDALYSQRSALPAAIGMLGEKPLKVQKRIMNWRRCYLLMEDHQNTIGERFLDEIANDIVPATSFLYMMNRFFIEKSTC